MDFTTAVTYDARLYDVKKKLQQEFPHSCGNVIARSDFRNSEWRDEAISLPVAAHSTEIDLEPVAQTHSRVPRDLCNRLSGETIWNS